MALTFSIRDGKAILLQLQQIKIWQDAISSLPEKYRLSAQKQARSMAGFHAFENTVRDELVYNKSSSLPFGADKLISDTVRCAALQSVAEQSAALNNNSGANIAALNSRLSACAGGLRRLFASSQKKQEAEQAYNSLSSLLDSGYAERIEALYAQAKRTEQMPDDALIGELEQNPDFYRSAAAGILGDIARGTVPEIQSLLDRHASLLRPFEAAEAAAQEAKAEVRAACDKLAAQETMAVLSGVPVEEANRDKGGFRVKSLRDSGYTTMADIFAAKPEKLAAVNGVSDEGAAALKQVASEYAHRSAASVKIRLSTDNKTNESTAVVCAVERYLRQVDVISEYGKIKEKYGAAVRRASQTLGGVGSGALWIFTPENEKQDAKNAFRFLSDLSENEYGQALTRLSAGVQQRISVTPGEAWSSFSENTVRFYNVIEEAAPGLLGSDKGVYGLPEDLAHEVQAEQFDSKGLRCELRKYQEWGVKYILNRGRVLLGDEMGLGKTVQAIAAMVSLRNSGAKRFAVVCPASVLSNWTREIEKHSDLPVVTVHGSGREKALDNWIKNGGVAVTTFETTARFELPEDFRFDMMVVDEAHYIKNAGARRSVNVKKLCEKAERLLFMTGTAIENKVDEMIALMEVLQPEITSGVKSMAFMSSAPQFREAIAPVYYRRKREDVLTELPELTESEEWCKPEGEEEKRYEQAVLDRRYADARRVSWSVDDLEQSSKARRMFEILNEAAEEGRKVIVFSFFLDTIQKVRNALQDKCVGPITGSVPPPRRQELIDEFDKAPAGTVLAAQIQSGGTGLNIQSASVIILCEPQLKPSIENQAISRAYRMGQSRNVLVYRLLCEDTVDERIMELLSEKQAIFDAFADKSAAADETFELDQKTFGEIMQEERARIEAKNGIGGTVEDNNNSAEEYSEPSAGADENTQPGNANNQLQP